MRHQTQLSLVFLILISWCVGGPATAASFSEIGAEPFGTFNDVEFVRYTGRFQGSTSLGDYDVPFEIVAPADPGLGNHTVLVEPPHWFLAPLGRDLIVGRDLIFGRGISYASVGFGTDGLNILDPLVPDPVIAGEIAENPGTITLSGTSDVGILVQFINALSSESRAVDLLGPLDRVYAYGQSRSADALVSLLHQVTGTGNSDILDLTFLHAPSWSIEFPLPPGVLTDQQEGEFTPLTDVGNLVYLQAEGDLLAFAADQFSRAADLENHRVYQVAGTAHLPNVFNPLDHWAVMRAIFQAGDEWMRFGIEPPESALIEAAPEGQIDPIYGVETGIARDTDGNARGGVRLPDLEVGEALFIASDPSIPTLGIPFLGPLTGNMVDLSCEPRPDGSMRFPNHGDYVNDYIRQANLLVNQGYLLPDDAEAMKEGAAESDIGKPGSCN